MGRYRDDGYSRIEPVRANTVLPSLQISLPGNRAIVITPTVVAVQLKEKAVATRYRVAIGDTIYGVPLVSLFIVPVISRGRKSLVVRTAPGDGTHRTIWYDARDIAYASLSVEEAFHAALREERHKRPSKSSRAAFAEYLIDIGVHDFAGAAIRTTYPEGFQHAQ